MKHVILSLLFCAFVFGVLACKATPKAPAKPSLVPNAAVWAGGVDGGSFFECDVDNVRNVNRCLLYNEHTGNVEGGGFFQLSGLHRAARQDELKYRFFDGDRIYVEAGTLEPIAPIVPNSIPKDSVFASGLFIHCGEMISGRTRCEIYRPDGNEYFKGLFAADAVLGGRIQDGYRFFELSDHTINLVSGGALIAK